LEKICAKFRLKNPNFRQKSQFSSKIPIFVKNPNFRQKSQFSSKIPIFVKNPNFRQKSKFSSISSIFNYYFSIFQIFAKKSRNRDLEFLYFFHPKMTIFLFIGNMFNVRCSRVKRIGKKTDGQGLRQSHQSEIREIWKVLNFEKISEDCRFVFCEIIISVRINKKTK